MEEPGVYSLGIDEAGRGSFVGPMALCGLYVRKPQDFEILSSLPLRDSKKLSPKARQDFYETLKNFDHQCILYPPSAIDAENINSLEFEGFIKLARQFKPKTLVLDAPVPPGGLPALTLKLGSLIATPRLIIENKADENYLVCMAASIIAKVTRDREIAKLKALFGDLGSGYPCDERTLSFLKSLNPDELKAFWPHLRKKWSTIKKLEVASVDSLV